MRIRLAQQQMMLRHEMVRHEMRGDVAAHRQITVATVATDRGHLERPLVNVAVIDVVRLERGIVARDRNVDG